MYITATVCFMFCMCIDGKIDWHIFMAAIHRILQWHCCCCLPICRACGIAMLLSSLQMYIEFCGGGAVDGIMQELEKPLTEPQIRCICHEMCDGLDFLHQNFVIHRDLKAGNVLLTADGQVRLG